MSVASRPAWLISYETTDISDDIADVVTRVRYTDHLKDKADELELTIEDASGLWRGPWYPAQGDRIALWIGYDERALLPCGRFEVDTIEMSGPPDTMTIRALSTGIASPLRTQVTRGFESVGLDAIVGQIAAEVGLTVVGDIRSELLKRVTQSGETNLAFLKRVAEEYGYAFTVRGEQLVFFEIARLEQEPPVVTIARDQLKSYRFRNSAQATYVACEVSFFDPETGSLQTARVEAAQVRPRTVASSAATAGASAPETMIQMGSLGDQVREWQRWLAGRGLYDYAIDGIFGDITDRGTRSFQQDAGIQVDGIVGPITYGAAIDQGFLPGGEELPPGASGDVLRERIRCESTAEAEAKAASLLRSANRLQVTGDIEIPGDQRVVAGTTIALDGLARLSGRYMVDRSTHTMTRAGGYVTRLEVSYVSAG